MRVMRYKEEVFLSACYLANYEQVKGQEAEELLKKQGYTFIHIDEAGVVHALAKDNQYIEGYKVYKRKVPCI